MKGTVPAEMFEAESHKLLGECTRKHLKESSPEVQSMFATLEGSTYLIYLSLKRNHEKLTLEETADLLTIESAKEAGDLLAAVSGLEVDAKKKQAVNPLILEPSTAKD